MVVEMYSKSDLIMELLLSLCLGKGQLMLFWDDCKESVVLIEKTVPILLN